MDTKAAQRLQDKFEKKNILLRLERCTRYFVNLTPCRSAMDKFRLVETIIKIALIIT